MELCEHNLDPENCNKCGQVSNVSFTVVDSVDENATRIKAEHPDWIVENLGWGIRTYNPNDPRWQAE